MAGVDRARDGPIPVCRMQRSAARTPVAHTPVSAQGAADCRLVPPQPATGGAGDARGAARPPSGGSG
eukprot:4254515-Pleurochrysis_carterae.AAC.1